MTAIEASIIGVIVIGLLHGLEPGHGWPLALLYSAKTTRPMFYAFVSSGILSLAHFASSIAVVLIYVVVSVFYDFSSPILTYIAAAVLIILAIKLFTEKVHSDLAEQHGHFHDNACDLTHTHEHEHAEVGLHNHEHLHPKRLNMSLWKLASCAFVLGFAHEEEFALLALAVGGVSPLLLMVAYGLAVAVGLIGVTLLGMKMYERVKDRISRYEKYIPKVSGVVLVVMAVALLLGVL
ncbi:MAG: nickel/cobalt transporter [Candidatus Bathyarchaeota archaeon]|nr:nickel/cobalt transporter [Candidatus Bathyarchaeota archaeon]